MPRNSIRWGARASIFGALAFIVVVATLHYIIIALDRPFRGAMAITPQSYELVYEQLMAPKRP